MAKKTKDKVSLSILMGALILGSTLTGFSVANAAEEDKNGFVLDQIRRCIHIWMEKTEL